VNPPCKVSGKGNFFFQAARDVTQLHILTGLDTEQHLANKLL